MIRASLSPLQHPPKPGVGVERIAIPELARLGACRAHFCLRLFEVASFESLAESCWVNHERTVNERLTVSSWKQTYFLLYHSLRIWITTSAAPFSYKEALLALPDKWSYNRFPSTRLLSKSRAPLHIVQRESSLASTGSGL